MEITKTVSDELLKEVISIRFSDCYRSMSFANAFSGCQSDTWDVLHNYKASEIIEEAKKRGIDYQNILIAIPEGIKVKDSIAFKFMGPISSEEHYNWMVAFEQENDKKTKDRVEGWDYYWKLACAARGKIYEYNRTMKANSNEKGN